MKSLDIITGAILVRRPTLEKVAGTILALGTTVGIRWAFDSQLLPTPFITFYPALLLLAVFYETRYAVGLMVGQLVLARMLLYAPPPGSSWLVLGLFFLGGASIMIGIGHLLRRTVLLLDERARQAETFNGELHHRTKNALQLMRSLAAGARRAENPDEFYEALAGRLDALAKANEMLGFGALPSCDVAELVESALKPFRLTRRDDQFELNGPAARVEKDAVVPLTMALHELCTNAEKYGALSVREGRIILYWEVRPEQGLDGGPALAFVWVERNGPPVVAKPTRRGLGSRLLSPHKGMREVNLKFDPEGVDCVIVVDGGPPDGRAEEPAPGAVAGIGRRLVDRWGKSRANRA